MASDPLNPRPGYSSLRNYRWSSAGCEYFVTSKLRRPASGLNAASLLPLLEAQRQRLESDAQWRVRTWVVMPDHLHALFTLGEKASLAECLRLFKGRLSPALRSHQLDWQDGYHEHRMRPDEDRLPVFLYIFLNPYRAGCISTSMPWPGYFCSPDDWAWFGQMTDSNLPFPEWIGPGN